jgi:NAD(P)H-hydrate epimerase
MAGSPTVGILAGRGNNGGDGFVVARHLANRGFPVRILALGDLADFRSAGAAGTNFRIAERLRLSITAVRRAEDLLGPLADAAVIVDAMLGTGLTGSVRGLIGECIDLLNASERHRGAVYALDIPSGLDCDTGLPLGRAVRAAATATFAAMKAGLVDGRASEYTGPVDVVDIGAPVVWQ